MQFWCVLVCSGVFFGRFWWGSGVFWWFLVSSDVVLEGFLWVRASSGGLRCVLVSSGAVLVGSGWVLVGSGEFWCCLVGSGEFWCSFGVLGSGGLW